jgi:hypothetical protein
MLSKSNLTIFLNVEKWPKVIVDAVSIVWTLIIVNVKLVSLVFVPNDKLESIHVINASTIIAK